jgi:hypothetical protein
LLACFYNPGIHRGDPVFEAAGWTNSVCIVGAGGEDTAGSPPWRLIRMPWGMGDRSAALGGSLGCLELIIQGIQGGGNLIGGEDQLGLEIGPVDRGVAALDDQPAGCRIDITQVILVETDAAIGPVGGTSGCTSRSASSLVRRCACSALRSALAVDARPG